MREIEAVRAELIALRFKRRFADFARLGETYLDEGRKLDDGFLALLLNVFDESGRRYGSRFLREAKERARKRRIGDVGTRGGRAVRSWAGLGGYSGEAQRSTGGSHEPKDVRHGKPS